MPKFFRMSAAGGLLILASAAAVFPAPTLAQGIECYRGPPYYWCPGDPPIGGGGGGGGGSSSEEDVGQTSIRQAGMLNVEGLALFRSNNPVAAARKFRQALAHCPTCETIRANLVRAEAIAINNEGAALFSRGNYKGALAKYRQALRLCPNCSVVRTNVARGEAAVLNEEGTALADAGDWAGALAKTRRALKLYPTAEVIRSNLAKVEGGAAYHEGLALAERGDYAGAIVKFKRAQKAFPDSKGIREDIAGAEQKLKAQQQAEAERRARAQQQAKPTTPPASGTTGAAAGTAFFGTQGTPPKPNLKPVEPTQTVTPGTAIGQLQSAAASGQSAAAATGEPAQVQAGCGFDNKPCAPPAAMPAVPPVAIPLTPAASALADHVAKNELAMDEKIGGWLNWYLSLDRQLTEKRIQLAAIEKEIATGKRDRQILDAEKGTITNSIKDFEANQSRAKGWIKDRMINMGLSWPGEATPSPPTAPTSGTVGGPSPVEAPGAQR